MSTAICPECRQWGAHSTNCPNGDPESEREDELLQMSYAELIATVMELEDKLARAQLRCTVPREPTKAMFDAGIQVWKDFAASPRGTFPTPADVWRAMHDAAPK